MAGRLAALPEKQTAHRVTVKTFHAFGASVLRQHGERIGLNVRFAILTDDDRQALLKQARPELKQQELDRILAQISAAKGRLLDPDSPELAASPALHRFTLATKRRCKLARPWTSTT